MITLRLKFITYIKFWTFLNSIIRLSFLALKKFDFKLYHHNLSLLFLLTNFITQYSKNFLEKIFNHLSCFTLNQN